MSKDRLALIHQRDEVTTQMKAQVNNPVQKYLAQVEGTWPVSAQRGLPLWGLPSMADMLWSKVRMSLSVTKTAHKQVYERIIYVEIKTHQIKSSETAEELSVQLKKWNVKMPSSSLC